MYSVLVCVGVLVFVGEYVLITSFDLAMLNRLAPGCRIA